MASAKENVPNGHLHNGLARPQPLPRQNRSSPRPPPPIPLRPKMANGATEPPPVSGVLKCMCFRLPSRTSKKPPVLHPAPKLSCASRRSAVAPDVSAAMASKSQRVTFRASASLSTRWPSSPSAAPAPAGSGRSVVAPGRASTSSAVLSPTAASSSFSHWRRRSLSSPRVTPHGDGQRASFSFAVSPSSCMNTPKIPKGWQHK